jgi:hypothetical protein
LPAALGLHPAQVLRLSGGPDVPEQRVRVRLHADRVVAQVVEGVLQ